MTKDFDHPRPSFQIGNIQLDPQVKTFSVVDGIPQRPAHYTRLHDYVQCRCLNEWVEADGSRWCCGGNSSTAASVMPVVPVVDEVSEAWRDHFAGQALLNGGPMVSLDADELQQIAKTAYDVADAMMAERARRSAR